MQRARRNKGGFSTEPAYQGTFRREIPSDPASLHLTSFHVSITFLCREHFAIATYPTFKDVACFLVIIRVNRLSGFFRLSNAEIHRSRLRRVAFESRAKARERNPESKKAGPEREHNVL